MRKVSIEFKREGSLSSSSSEGASVGYSEGVSSDAGHLSSSYCTASLFQENHEEKFDHEYEVEHAQFQAAQYS